MNTSLLALGVAFVIIIGFVLSLALLNLFTGAVHFLFIHPRICILKSKKGENGFAFSFSNAVSGEKASFDQVRLRLFNPFGDPTQVDLVKDFPKSDDRFAHDVDLGPGFRKFLSAKGTQKADIQIEISESKGNLSYSKLLRAPAFFKERKEAQVSIDEFNQHKPSSQPTYNKIPQRDFMAPAKSGPDKALKIATNPEFATSFAAAGGSAAPKENFSVSKVWIDPGCIVCNACEAIFPEVFEVTEDTCLIRPNAPLDDGLKIEEAADACPVEVIKFVRA